MVLYILQNSEAASRIAKTASNYFGVVKFNFWMYLWLKQQAMDLVAAWGFSSSNRLTNVDKIKDLWC